MDFSGCVQALQGRREREETPPHSHSPLSQLHLAPPPLIHSDRPGWEETAAPCGNWHHNYIGSETSAVCWSWKGCRVVTQWMTPHNMDLEQSSWNYPNGKIFMHSSSEGKNNRRWLQAYLETIYADQTNFSDFTETDFLAAWFSSADSLWTLHA